MDPSLLDDPRPPRLEVAGVSAAPRSRGVRLCVSSLLLSLALPASAQTVFKCVGPSGGVVYPFLVVWFRGGTCSDLDAWLIAHTPQLLESLSTPPGDFIVISGGGLPSPTLLILVSALLGAVVYLAAVWLRKLQRDSRVLS